MCLPLYFTANVIKLSTRSRSQQLKPGGILFAHLQKNIYEYDKKTDLHLPENALYCP